MPYLSFYKNPGVNRTYHFFTILDWTWPILKFFFANFLQLFEGKKIIEGVIWQKFAEVRNESIGNKLQLCFSEDLSQTFRTPLKNGFKKVGRVTGIRPPYRINPALPYGLCLFLGVLKKILLFSNSEMKSTCIIQY